MEESVQVIQQTNLDQFLNSGFRGNFTPYKHEIDVDDLIETSFLAEQKGLKLQAKNLRRQVLSIALNSRGMSLISADNLDSRLWQSNGDRFQLYRITPDMREDVIFKERWSNGNPMPLDFRINDLTEYEKPIPAEIIKKIPQDLIDKSEVFYPVQRRMTDPIIFIRLSKNYNTRSDFRFWAIGLYQWE